MTYEEYFNAIKDVLRVHLKGHNLSEEALESYMQSQEEEIKHKYRSDKKGYDEGKYTEKVFKNGCVNSTAWCLYLIY